MRPSAVLHCPIPHTVYSHSVNSHSVNKNSHSHFMEEAWNIYRKWTIEHCPFMGVPCIWSSHKSLDNQKSLKKKYWAKMGADLGKDPKGYFLNQLYPQKPLNLGFGYLYENSGCRYKSLVCSQKSFEFTCIFFAYVSLLSDGWLLTSTF